MALPDDYTAQLYSAHTDRSAEERWRRYLRMILITGAGLSAAAATSALAFHLNRITT